MPLMEDSSKKQLYCILHAPIVRLAAFRWPKVFPFYTILCDFKSLVDVLGPGHRQKVILLLVFATEGSCARLSCAHYRIGRTQSAVRDRPTSRQNIWRRLAFSSFR